LVSDKAGELVAGLVSTVHQIAGTRNPIWRLSDEEEKLLGSALADVIDAYAPSVLTKMTEGTVALIALLVVSARIYTPRAVALSAEIKEKKKKAIENVAGV
jgi:hypothetical protein